MKLTFLGTSAAQPTRARNVSGLALQLVERGEWWLFDCGEGTQHQVLRAGLSLARLTRIFLSHLHGDHCFGLPGLLASRGLLGATGTLAICGPPGVREYLASVQQATGMQIPYPLEFQALSSEQVCFEDDELKVQTVLVAHGPLTLAQVVIEKPRTGRFRVEEARALGVPEGPLFGELKRGQRITLADGRVVDGTALVAPPIPGRVVALVADTCDARSILPHARGAQVLVHEATYLERDEAQLARERGHSTAASAGRLAREAGVELLVLTHFSPRYEQSREEGPQIGDLVAEAEAAFLPGRVRAAADLMTLEIPRRG